MRKKFLLRVLACSLLAFSCKEENPTMPPPEQGQETRTDTQLIVDKYELPAGETAEFPSGFEIVANNGVNIQGDILIKPEREGDFTIKCMNGDMILNGRIRVDSVSQSVNKKAGNSMINKGGETADGAGLNFILNTVEGHLILDKNFQAVAGEGSNAGEELITGNELNVNGGYLGTAGGNGGYIYISANEGYILFEKRERNDPELFILGSGGNGADLKVDNNTFNTSQSRLLLVGGAGGKSGYLQIFAKDLLGLENIPPGLLISTGYGGEGGDAVWDVSGLLSQGPPLNKDITFPITEIILQGGNGGDAATLGGNGGDALYLSYTVINKRGDPVATAMVLGGNGGKVTADFLTAAKLNPEFTRIPVPVKYMYGGDGGGVIALGNMGWNGVHPDSGGPVNGADGGDVTALGGNGGDVDENVAFLEEAGGGDGGQPQEEYKREYFLYSHQIRDAKEGFASLEYGVLAGSGGKGASDCEGCPGGNGGNAGKAEARGGHGGNAPHISGGKGGDGGDTWTTASISLRNASGGNGNEPGTGGCPGTVSAAPGKGGLAYTPGLDGKLLGQQQGNTPCAPDGSLCGEGLNKINDHCGDDQDTVDTDCWKKLGSTFTAFYETSRKITVSTGAWNEVKISISEQGTLTEIYGQYNDRFKWDITGTKLTQIRTSDGRGDRDTIEYYTDYINTNRVSSPAHEARIPRCINGNLYLPNGSASASYRNEFTDSTNGSFIQDNITLQFGGCNPFLVNTVYTDPDNWRCCDFIGYRGAVYGDCP